MKIIAKNNVPYYKSRWCQNDYSLLPNKFH